MTCFTRIHAFRRDFRFALTFMFLFSPFYFEALDPLICFHDALLRRANTRADMPANMFLSVGTSTCPSEANKKIQAFA